MARRLGLLASSIIWYPNEQDPYNLATNIEEAMRRPGDVLRLELANNGLALLRTDALNYVCVFEVDVPDELVQAPFRPGVSSVQPDRIIM